jgi:Tfp pilus assembly protein PilO
VSAAGELAMFLAIGLAALGLFFGPVGSALAQRLVGRPQPDEIRAEVEKLGEQVIAEMDELRHQLAEVEERLDFAERLLTHDAPANQLPGRAQQ